MSTEEIFACVQCGGKFKESENVSGACFFHKTPMSDRKYSCCGQNAACQKNTHRAKHHCEYEYEALKTLAWGINNYTDTHTKWSKVSDTDLSSDRIDQQATVAKMLRWKSKAGLITENVLLVFVGSFSHKWWWLCYTETDLDAIGKAGTELIFRTSDSTESYSSASWIITNNIVTGIRLEAKAKSSEQASVSVCTFTSFPLTKGEETIVSRGGIVEAKPASEYTLPAVVRMGEQIEKKEARAPKTELPVQGTKNVKIKQQEIKANEKTTPKNSDKFQGSFSLITTEKEPICFESIACEWRLVGNKDWNPVMSFLINGKPPVPLTVNPLQSVVIYFDIEVEDKTKNGRRWFYKPWVARHQPIRFKMTFTTLTGDVIYKVFEYVQKSHVVDQDKPGTNILWLNADVLDEYERFVFIIKESGEGEGYSVDIDGTAFNVDRLRKLVYAAQNSGQTEQLVLDTTSQKKDCIKKAWALVDLSCKRVYAIKAMIMTKEGKSCSMGYAKLKLYGFQTDTKPNQPAKEVETAPTLTASSQDFSNLAQDDDFDDKFIEIDTPAPTPDPSTGSGGGGGGGGGVITMDTNAIAVLQNINQGTQRMADSFTALSSMESHMEKMAGSLELLLDILTRGQK